MGRLALAPEKCVQSACPKILKRLSMEISKVKIKLVERGTCSLALNGAPKLWRGVLVQVPVGFGRAMRLCAARTRLFRLIYTQKGRCAPRPRYSQLRCLYFMPEKIYVQYSNSAPACVISSPSSAKAPQKKMLSLRIELGASEDWFLSLGHRSLQ